MQYSNDFNKQGVWNLECLNIVAMYYSKEVRGFVTNSRVKYGGKVQHTVRLDTPLETTGVYGEPRYTCLIDHEEIIAILDNN